VEHDAKSVADVQLLQEYVKDVSTGAATKETVEVRVELTAVAPLGAVADATTGVNDLYGELHVPEDIARYGSLSPSTLT
jgi:hypothetical protein